MKCGAIRGIKGVKIPFDHNIKNILRKRNGVPHMLLAKAEIEDVIKGLLRKYHAEYAVLFGSYARGDATEDSDIDIIVAGGEKFRAIDIFAFGEELRQLTNKNVDAFEIREVDKGTEFYNNILREGVRIA